MGYCAPCGNIDPKPLIKDQCQYHYWQGKRTPIKAKPILITPKTGGLKPAIKANTIQKYKDKTLPQLLKIAEKHFNKHIRERDCKDGFGNCISCDNNINLKGAHAGHYLSAGHNASMRFNENNVHLQCVRCNFHLHGNQANYRMGLIEKIGKEAVEKLEQDSKWRGFKWDKFSVINIIEKYKLSNKL